MSNFLEITDNGTIKATKEAIEAIGENRLDAWVRWAIVIRPGKGIPGLQNYLERWTGTKHEFMRPAFSAFGSEARIARAVEENLGRQLRKVENEK